MTDDELNRIIQKAADEAAAKTVKKLKDAGRITYVFSNSFKKTEELLYLYPKLPEDNAERIRIDQALKKIETDDYYGVIPSRCFDGMTIAEIKALAGELGYSITKTRKAEIIAEFLAQQEV